MEQNRSQSIKNSDQNYCTDHSSIVIVSFLLNKWKPEYDLINNNIMDRKNPTI